MYKSRRRRALDYALAVLIVLPALYFTHTTSLRTGAPFLLLIAAVTFSTWFSGFEPGLVTFALTLVGAIYFLAEPEGSLVLSEPSEIVRLPVFAFIALFICLLTAERERARQQARARAAREQALAEVGARALANLDLMACFDHATVVICQALGVDHSYVLELAADGKSLLMKAGCGWKPGTVGHATLPADPDSQVGLTVCFQEPVIVHIPLETRFTPPPLLLDHSIASGLTVSIHGPERPYGILGAFATHQRGFTAEDIDLLQSVANLLSLAVQHKRADESLRQGETQYRTLVENAPDIISRIDRNMHVSYTNPAPTKLTGVPAEQFLGKTASQVGFPAPLAQSIEDKVRTVFGTGQPADLEFDLTIADGHRYFDTRLVPEVAPNGAVDSVLALTRDMTASKQAEQALRLAHGLLETLFSSIDLAVAYMDSNFNFIRVNRAYARLDEREPESFVGQNYFDLYPDSENKALFHRVVETGEAYSAYAQPFESAGHRSRGASYWDWSLQPVQDVGRQVNGVVLSLVNVTEHVRAENASRETAEQLQRVLAHAPLALWALDRAGRYTLFEGNLAARFHARSSNMIGTCFWDRTLDQPDLQDVVRRAYQGEETCIDLEHAGRVMRNHTWPIHDARGEVAGVMGMVLDITEARHAEQALNTAMQHTRNLAEQVVRAQEEERRNVAHVLHEEAAQALAAVTLNLQDIRGELPAESAVNSKVADAAALTARTIVQIRSLAEYLHPPALPALGLNRTLAGCCEDVACDDGIHVEYHGIEIERVSEAVAITLYRFLQEALSNAVQRACVQARVSLVRGIESLSLTVEDDGEVFDSQLTLLKAERRGEPGLQSLRERIKLLGGTLEIESTPTGDNRLIARLPL